MSADDNNRKLITQMCKDDLKSQTKENVLQIMPPWTPSNCCEIISTDEYEKLDLVIQHTYFG